MTPREMHEHFRKQDGWGWGNVSPNKRRIIKSEETYISPHTEYGDDIITVLEWIKKAIDKGCNYCYSEVRLNGIEYPNQAITYAVKYHIETDEEYTNRIKGMIDFRQMLTDREISSLSESLKSMPQFELYK